MDSISGSSRSPSHIVAPSERRKVALSAERIFREKVSGAVTDFAPLQRAIAAPAKGDVLLGNGGAHFVRLEHLRIHEGGQGVVRAVTVSVPRRLETDAMWNHALRLIIELLPPDLAPA